MLKTLENNKEEKNENPVMDNSRVRTKVQAK